MATIAPKTFFVTGTDTDVGKTLVACAMLSAAGSAGLSTVAVKPVAAGVSQTAVGRHNADAVALADCCSLDLDIDTLNPVCFDNPIAPHIAARKAGVTLAAESLARKSRHVLDLGANLTLIEGAGGWYVPLGEQETMADLVRQLEVPVIMVVGMRLGCLNHALLTARAIEDDGLRLAGWIANHLSADMAMADENRDTLRSMLPVPMLAEIPWLDVKDRVARAANSIDLARILQS